ncbi:hypothetical protein C8Q74DRAFT_1295285 [Fomes fomentarius]|nr:hypothetical protein C8Q74DRAFT_1295285 [Fomes fomentarius]
MRWFKLNSAVYISHVALSLSTAPSTLEKRPPRWMTCSLSELSAADIPRQGLRRGSVDPPPQPSITAVDTSALRTQIARYRVLLWWLLSVPAPTD